MQDGELNISVKAFIVFPIIIDSHILPMIINHQDVMIKTCDCVESTEAPIAAAAAELDDVSVSVAAGSWGRKKHHEQY